MLAPGGVSAFFSKFVNDTLFQKARIQFPIEISILDENYQPKTEWIHKEAFVALQFQSDKAANLGEYRQDIVVNNTKAEIQIRGNETDISADYFFVLLDGKWFLKSWADHSL